MGHSKGCNCSRCEGMFVSQMDKYKPKLSLTERLAKQRQENYAASEQAFEMVQKRKGAQKAYDLTEQEWYERSVFAKVFSSCIGAAIFSPSVDGEKKPGLEKGMLNKKIESNYKKGKSSWEPMICYSIALKAGVLDKTIKKETRDTINGMLKGGYNQRYSDLMGVTISTTRKNFDASLVKESGIINFIDDKNSRVVHTAYIKKNKDGSVEMFHANNMSLDGALSKGRELNILGPTTYYELSDDYISNSLNNWLRTSEHSFKFTPASELSLD